MKLTELQERWLTELESGKHKQCQNKLYDGQGYCCLGIFARFVLGIEPRDAGNGLFIFNREYAVLAKADAEALGLFDALGSITSDRRESLTSMNDTDKSFKDIAAFVRAYPEKVFKQGAED